MYAYFTKYSWLLRTQARNIILFKLDGRGVGWGSYPRASYAKPFANLKENLICEGGGL